MSNEQWLKPKTVGALDLICGGDMSVLLPKYDDIPEEFKKEQGEAEKWVTVVEDWFFTGIRDAKWVVKPEVNIHTALRHIKSIMMSFEPQHEHKTAGVAYLMSLWFDDVVYEKVKH